MGVIALIFLSSVLGKHFEDCTSQAGWQTIHQQIGLEGFHSSKRGWHVAVEYGIGFLVLLLNEQRVLVRSAAISASLWNRQQRGAICGRTSL